MCRCDESAQQPHIAAVGREPDAAHAVPIARHACAHRSSTPLLFIMLGEIAALRLPRKQTSPTHLLQAVQACGGLHCHGC
jgi:hypothetical protein